MTALVARPRVLARAAALLGLLAVTVIALAAAGALRPERAEARAAGRPLMQVPAAAPGCVQDPEGDTTREDSGEREAFPRADLVEACMGEDGGALTVSAQVVEPTDPGTDPNWDDEDTFVAWGLDTDSDGMEDVVVVFGVESDGELEGVVVEEETGTEVCDDLAARFDSDSGRTIVEDIPRSCAGDATTVAFTATAFYDSDAQVTDAPVYSDLAADPDPPPSPAPSPSPPQPPPPSPSSPPSPSEPGTPTPPADGTDRDTGRVAGGSRIETAIAISERQFPDGAETAYLARADVLADAVAAGSLTDGPVLLVPTCGQVPPAVATELDRLDPGRVTGLGGQEAVCSELLDQAADDRPTDRLAGAERIATAIAIANRSFPDGADEAYLARADEFADAVAGGALTRGPILLVPTCGDVPGSVAAELVRLGPGRVAALGGTAAVCDALLADVAADAGAQEQRIAGVDRIGTAAAIARYQFGEGGAATVYLARADEFADAVAGGALTDGPILLVPSCGDLPDVVADVIRELDPDSVVALGGQQAICDAILDHVVTLT